MEYKGEDIIDIKKISQLLESYTKATGLVSALLDLDGNILCQSGWQKICAQFHRINPETAKNCHKSDTILAGNLQDGNKYNIYKCLNGLVDIAVPIIVNDIHIYNLFTGQLFMEAPKEEFFISQAAKYDFDKKEYMDALRQVPILNESEIKNKLLFLSQMTEMIVELSLAKYERIKSNIALKESEEKFRALYDNAPLSYQSLNEDGSFNDINPTWLSTLGYERNEIIGKFYKDFLHPDWQAHFKDNFTKFKKRGYVNDVQFKIRHKSGHYLDISFEGCIGYLPDGSFKQTYCVFQDITERKKAETEIKNLNENLEESVKNRTRELDGKALKLEKSQQALTFLLEDVNDIKKQLEISNNKLQDANKELEAFSYSVSHDLKAPLRAVIGFSQILKEDFAPQLDSESKRYVNLIIDNAKNMGILIKDLLNFSRMARIELQKSQVDLRILGQRVKSELIADYKDRELNINMMDMPLVNADEKLIYHVMLNLISNAVKFTGKVENAIVEIGCTSKNNENVFYVRDNGVGFNMKYAGKIFAVFQRLHSVEEFPGTGIGLSIVQRIIHKHGGRVWVESELNIGTTFFFTL